jgi:hypothetical protein
MTFREGDLIKDLLGDGLLIVKKVLVNNRLLVNFAEPRPGQPNWVVYASDYIKQS